MLVAFGTENDDVIFLFKVGRGKIGTCLSFIQAQMGKRRV